MVSLCPVFYAYMNTLPNKIIMMMLCIYINFKIKKITYGVSAIKEAVRSRETHRKQ